MITDKNSFKISINGGSTYTNMAEYLTEVETSYNKLWSNDTGRNLAGKTSGTLIGIFPKFILHFRPLTQTELHTLAPILDSATQKIQYHDDDSGTTKTIDTYSGDWSVSNKHINENEAFNCSFIAREKRS